MQRGTVLGDGYFTSPITQTGISWQRLHFRWQSWKPIDNAYKAVLIFHWNKYFPLQTNYSDGSSVLMGTLLEMPMVVISWGNWFWVKHFVLDQGIQIGMN